MMERSGDWQLRSAWARYSVALTLFAVALSARLLLLPVEARLAFSTFLPAVVVAFYLCGLAPGALIAVLSTVAGIYFFSPPYYTFDSDVASTTAAGAFLVGCAVTGWVVHRLDQSSRALREAHGRLSASERLLQSVVGDQSDMVFRFRSDGRFLFANPAGRRAFGLRDDTLSSLTWHVLVPEDERSVVTERLREFSPEHAVVTTETRVPGIGGETRWGEFVHHALFDEVGQLVEVQTVGRDITERRRLQQQLTEASTSLQDLYDGAPCGYYSLDRRGIFVKVNATMLGWLGCKPDEVIGKLGPKSFFTAEGVTEFDRHFPKFLAEGHIGPLEFDLVGRGETRRVSVSATAVRDATGAILYSRSVMYDITEVARMRAEVDALNRQLWAILDNDLVGIVKLRNRRIVWKNRAFGRIFGYSQSELLGQESTPLYPDRASFEAFGHASRDVLANGGIFRATIELRRKDGTPVWADCSGTMLDLALGESIWFCMDVTASRREEQLRIQAADLSAANHQLRETARLHSMFLANMSHELRTPLNAVIGFAGILKWPTDESKRVRYLDQIASSGQHLLAMIDSMLELSKQEGGRITLNPSPIEPAAVVREVVDMIESEARQHRVTLRTELPAEVPVVVLDPLRLRQVLLNYLSNAIKFSHPEGRVVARASMVTPDRLRIEVQDDGIGIPPEDQARLFVRFQQLSAGTTKAYPGTGIGLALVKQIVEAQGGQVGVRSTAGEGSVFWAELPCGMPLASTSA